MLIIFFLSFITVVCSAFAAAGDVNNDDNSLPVVVAVVNDAAFCVIRRRSSESHGWFARQRAYSTMFSESAGVQLALAVALRTNRRHRNSPKTAPLGRPFGRLYLANTGRDAAVLYGGFCAPGNPFPVLITKPAVGRSAGRPPPVAHECLSVRRAPGPRAPRCRHSSALSLHHSSAYQAIRLPATAPLIITNHRHITGLYPSV